LHIDIVQLGYKFILLQLLQVPWWLRGKVSAGQSVGCRFTAAGCYYSSGNEPAKHR